MRIFKNRMKSENAEIFDLFSEKQSKKSGDT